MFRLTSEEWKALQKDSLSQIATSSVKFRPTNPLAFTEHGVTMLASVLRSERAVQMNIAIVRAFIVMRHLAVNDKELAMVIADLEKKMNPKFKDVWQALNFLLDRREEQGEWEDRSLIGFNREKE